MHNELIEQVQSLQTTLDHVGAYVFSKDLQGRYTYANKAVCDVFASPRSEIIGQDDSKFFSLEQSNDILENDKLVMQQGRVIKTEEHTVLASTGERRYYFSEKKPRYDADQNIIGIFGVSIDITDIKKATMQQTTHSEILSQIVNKAPLKITLELLIKSIENLNFHAQAKCSILLVDSTGKRLVHGAAPNLPDFYNNEVDGIEIGSQVGSCGAAAYSKNRVIVEDISTHPNWAGLNLLAKKAGLGSCWSEPILSTEGKLLGTLGIYHDKPATPTENDIKLIEFASQLATLAIEQHLALKQEQLFQQIFDNSHDSIILMDSDGCLSNINTSFTNITGYTLDDIAGKKIEHLDSTNKNSTLFNAMWRELDTNHHWQGELWSYKKNGDRYAQLLTMSVIFDDDGKLTNYVGIFTDITGRKRQQEALELMAHYDQLTKLPNRSLFADRCQQAIAQSKRAQKQLAVCFIDLDNFKPINDTFGHKIGDLLLIEVANRLTAVVREQDTVSRQGGDEFVVLLKDIDPEQHYKQVIERIHHSLAQPYYFDNQQHTITASSGIAIYPTDGDDIDTLLRHADQAMYQAKIGGKHRYEFFNLPQNKAWAYKNQHQNDIEDALNNNEFCLYYQPKVDMSSGEVYGMEALIRWIHPEKGLIPPLDFLPFTEGTEVEIKIGNWVLNQALIQLNSWHQLGCDLQVSVNISSKHLQSDGFISLLAGYMANYPAVEPKYLELEVVENSAFSNLSKISAILTSCQKQLGVSFALDDFGTGYSSLVHLRNLSVDIIKIDRDFVDGVLNDPSDYAIIDSVISLANAFNKDIIAEGIETTEQGLMLLNMGCRKAQGFAISRPIPAEDIPSWIANYIPKKEWQHYGNKTLTLRERKIDLFILLGKAWYEQFISSIKASPEKNELTPPLLLNGNCHCEYWLERAKQEQVFAPETLTEFEVIHDNLLALSGRVFDQYQSGQVDEARISLDEVTSLYKDMIFAVKQCQ